MTQQVAALYVEGPPRGPYPKLLGPEYCWDEARDARTYAGPWSVIAHPPCGPWGKLAFCSLEGAAVPPGIKVCSAQQRRRTPVAFAEWLIALARTARVDDTAGARRRLRLERESGAT